MDDLKRYLDKQQKLANEWALLYLKAQDQLNQAATDLSKIDDLLNTVMKMRTNKAKGLQVAEQIQLIKAFKGKNNEKEKQGTRKEDQSK